MSRPAKPSTLLSTGCLEDDRRRRECLERTKESNLKRISEALEDVENADEKTKEVKDFLYAVVRNMDSIGSHLQIRDEEKDRLVDISWSQLVGSTLYELDLSPRIRLLLLDVIFGILPDEDPASGEELARAAGMPGIRSASPETVSRFKREGLLMAFVAKIFLDSKFLMAEGDSEAVSVYFGEAETMVNELINHPYLDSRDARFLEVCKKRHGDLDKLVSAQRKTVLSGVDSKEEHPELEKVLRRLLTEDYGKSRVEPMQDWWSEAQKEFTPVRFVFSEIDEFRRKVQQRMRVIEREEPLRDPDLVLRDADNKLRELIEGLQVDLRNTPVRLLISGGRDVNLLDIIRRNSKVLSADYAVKPFKRFMGREDLVEIYARHKVAAFQKTIPDLRERLRSSLYVCDELYRSAPLGDDQKEELDGLRREIVAYAESQGHPVPEKVLNTPWNVPFAEEVFALLATKEEFAVFEKWLTRIREVYDRAPQSLPAASFEPLETIGFMHEAKPKGKRTLADSFKTTTMLGISAFKLGVDEPSGEKSESPQDGEQPIKKRKSSVGRIWKWRLWPWNWFSS